MIGLKFRPNQVHVLLECQACRKWHDVGFFSTVHQILVYGINLKIEAIRFSVIDKVIHPVIQYP